MSDEKRVRPSVVWAVASIFWMPFVCVSIVMIVGLIANGGFPE